MNRSTRNSRSRLLLAVFVLAGLAACSDITFVGGGPVTIKLTANKTAVPAGGSVTFAYEVKGTYLEGVIIDYDDGAADTVFTVGSQTASGTFGHAFELPGEYTVIATADDSSTGTATAQVVITVGGS